MCTRLTHFARSSRKMAVLRVEFDQARAVVIEGLVFEGSDYSAKQREIWGAAKPILHGIAPSESDGICRLSYDAPNDPVHLAFYCKSRFGE